MGGVPSFFFCYDIILDNFVTSCSESANTLLLHVNYNAHEKISTSTFSSGSR